MPKSVHELQCYSLSFFSQKLCSRYRRRGSFNGSVNIDPISYINGSINEESGSDPNPPSLSPSPKNRSPAVPYRDGADWGLRLSLALPFLTKSLSSRSVGVGLNRLRLLPLNESRSSCDKRAFPYPFLPYSRKKVMLISSSV